MPIEVAIVLLCLAANATWPSFKRVGLPFAAIFLSVGALLHLIDVASSAIYGRTIDLIFDAAQIPHVLELMAVSMGWFIVAPLTLAVLAILAGTVGLFALAARYLGAQMESLAPPAGMKKAVAGLTLLVAAQAVDLTGIVTSTAMASSAPAIQAASYHAKIISLWFDDGRAVVDEYRQQRGEVRDGETTLPRLAGTNVYLIFVESYGASLLERDEHRAVIEGLYDRYDDTLNGNGREAVSTLLESPTYGGLSWLAHLTSTAGAWIDTNLEYRAYLRSDLDTMTQILRRSGYETSLVMPGIQRYWPESRLLRFDHVYTAGDLDYGGVRFGYFGIPDQFTLERIPELISKDRPNFVQLALISSHYPFRPIPPFIEDRTKILDGSVWAPAAEAAGSFTRADWADPADGYIAGAAYSLRAALDFAERHTKPDDLVIILGDHQPWSVVSGNLGGRAAPIHVISGRKDLIACFLADGYRPGLAPKRGEVLYGMDWILQRMVAHFGDRGPAEGCARPFGAAS
ncbi:sulfatase-like hydrolase/transferase [Hwanghaeella grinnelliae]|uniref:sulfatase-like hydrolase/transferase n=1 Tax=Hwanghaeella grinnelliae TaxID=2500179 RepID=UPI001387361C|nr:sulfatase-like hydrolase/transferase [Hwanghaeella grinnelliae]